MPIDSKHPSYASRAPLWQRIRDVVSGEDAVKANAAAYLPRPEGMSATGWEGYVKRADFYEASGRTLLGLTGAVFRKPPVVDDEEKVRPFVEHFGADGAPLAVVAKTLISDVIAVGRYGFLVDVPPGGGAPYAAGYPAEAIINWRSVRVNHAEILTLVVLRECTVEAKADDPYEMAEVERFRVLTLAAPGDGEPAAEPGVAVYAQELYRKVHNKATGRDDFLRESRTVPTVRGAPLTRIPFVFCGVIDNCPEPNDPPLLPLVNKNLSHFRSAADLEHGAHFTALPTPVIIGNIGTADGAGSVGQLAIGSGTAWHLTGEGADAKFLEFSGQGLTALETRCGEKAKQMAVLGARLLEDQKSGVEAAATVELRHNGENSLLASIADTASRALTAALDIMASWSAGRPPASETGEAPAATVELNRDFFGSVMPMTDVVALVNSWMTGGVGGEFVYHSLKDGERLPEGWTFEDFKRDIEENGPASTFGAGMPGEDPNADPNADPARPDPAEEDELENQGAAD